MTQIPWSSVLRTTRNYYLLSFLLKESASLIWGYVVNFTNPCDMRAKCQVAVMINKIFRGRFWENTWKFINDADVYILNVFRDADGKSDWKNNVVCDGWIRKIKKRHVIDLENVFFFQRRRIKKKKSTNFCFPASLCTNILNVSDCSGGRADRNETHFLL